MRGMFRKGLASVVVFALLFAVAEVVARFVWSPDDLYVSPSNAAFEDDPLLFWKLKPDLVGFRDPMSVIDTNALGLRDDPVVSPKGVDLALIACRRDRGASRRLRCANRTAA